MGRYHFVFPPWTNMVLPAALILGAIAPLYVIFIVAYGFSPITTAVGYQPTQPIPFSHDLHVGQLGMDCRYCHTTVEHSRFASIPPTETCMGCHTQIRKESPALVPLWDSYNHGTPIEWIRVHNLPDHAYFDHAAHVNRGVSCVECHGRIDRMVVVAQHAPLSMGWCLDCHRNPQPSLRDPSKVTDLAWDFDGIPDRATYQNRLHDLNRIQPPQDCSACHR
ncbi:MAG TPA: cytochrome c3 family protein [Phycisphaerales bacterium]|nr:cytochrome c3 family protein [Phycisphaerales bacterium]HRQ76619.1 cytochrome c3 family protein [Phycisphaerales bacterium]